MKFIDLKQVISSLTEDLYKHRYLNLGIVFLISALAASLSLLLPDKFKVDSEFIISQQNLSKNLAGLGALMGGDLFPMKQNSVADHLDVFILDEGFLDFFFQRKWTIGGKPTTIMEHLFEDVSKNDSIYYVRKARKLIPQTFFSIVNSKNKFQLNTLTNDSTFSYELNLAILGAIEDFLKRNDNSNHKRNVRFLEGRLEESALRLEKQKRQLVEFETNNRAMLSPDLRMAYAELQRNYTVSQELYLQLTKQLELSRFEEKRDEPFLVILRHPEFPVTRTFPNRTLITITAFMFGCILVLAVTWIRLNFDDK